LIIAAIRAIIRRRLSLSPNTPITVKNLTKYLKLSTEASS
jgi:hypothetical protein